MIGYMLIKGFIIGVIFGIPVGAVGAMTIQRTLNFGFFAGISSGLGSSVSDVFYACIGAFGITIVSDFVLNNNFIINIIGIIILFYIGIKLLFIKNNEKKNKKLKKSNNFIILLSSFAVGFTNPAAILSFLFAFSYFEVVNKINLNNGIFLILGVFAGTALWWFILVSAVSLLKNKIKANNIVTLNKCFGITVIIFSFIILIKIFIN